MAQKKASGTKETTKASIVKTGSKVKVDYVGSFQDGKIFDSSLQHGQPIEFVVGSGQVIPGFDKAIDGMKAGDEKTVTIPAEDAYGEKRDDLVKVITRDKLPATPEPKEGMMLALGFEGGVQLPARITKVNKQMVTLDLNHPLAGKTLTFKLKVLEID